jgi:hypothetical protein
MKIFATVIAILMLASVAGANFAQQAGIVSHAPNAAKLALNTNHESTLPADFNYETGYSVYQLNDNTYVAYIAMGMGERDGEAIAYADNEGWLWDNSPGYTGDCFCDAGGGSPELRANDTTSYIQIPYLQFTIPKLIKKITIVSADFYAYNCEGYGSLTVEAWAGFVTGDHSYGTSHDFCCGGFAPYCDTTMPIPSWTPRIYCATTTVAAGGGWYSWDVTNCLKASQKVAPITGNLILLGVSGAGGYYQRFSSSCNTGHEGLVPYLMVVYTL